MMDIAQNTSVRPEAEKDIHYVSIETGSGISGYTKEYLERLCRLNKIRYRIWSNGQYAIELESLLNETHTILLSYEGIIFIDKRELTAEAPLPTPPVPEEKEVLVAPASNQSEAMETREKSIAEAIPTFSSKRQSIGEVETGMRFVGRAVVSDVDPVGLVYPESTEKAQRPLPSFPKAEIAETKTDAPPKILAKEIPSMGVVGGLVIPAFVAPITASQTPSPAPDAWDAMLLGGETAPSASLNPALRDREANPYLADARRETVKTRIYHPIQTSVDDPSLHYDPAPLYPPIGNSAASFGQSTVPRPDQRVITFDPKAPASLPHLSVPQRPKDPVPVQAGLASVAPPSQAPRIVPPPMLPADKQKFSGALPGLRVMPSTALKTPPTALPTEPSENALALRKAALQISQQHALMKSPGFNLVALVLIGGPALLFFGGFTDLQGALSSDTLQYTAGVGATGFPFSDEVVTAPGTEPNTIIVQPIFRDGAGSAQEYSLVPLSPVASSSSSAVKD